MTLASGEIMGQIFHIAVLGFELHLRLLPSHDALCSGWVKAEGRVSAKEHEVGASPGSQLSGQGTMARGPQPWDHTALPIGPWPGDHTALPAWTVAPGPHCFACWTMAMGDSLLARRRGVATLSSAVLQLEKRAASLRETA